MKKTNEKLSQKKDSHSDIYHIQWATQQMDWMLTSLFQLVG